MWKPSFLVLLLCTSLAWGQFGGWFTRLMENAEEDPRHIFREVFSDPDDTRSEESSSSSEKNENVVRILRPVVVHRDSFVSRDSSPQSPAGVFLDTAENLFTKMFSVLQPDVLRMKVQDLRPRILSNDQRKGASNVEKAEGESKDEGTTVDKVFNFIEGIGGVPFSSGATHLTGEHICTREVYKKTPADGSEERVSFRECRRFEKAHRCIDRKKNEDGTAETTRFQECCDGFDTEDIVHFGCTREVLLLSTRDTLDLANSSLVSLLEELGLEHLIDSTDQRRTFVVPPNDALDLLKKNFDEEQLRELLKNHIIEGDHRDYELEEGEELATEANATLHVSQRPGDSFDDSRKRTAAADGERTNLNCVELVQTNVRTTSGVIHYAADSLALSSSNILDFLEGTNRFKTFVSLITPDLERRLRSSGRFTVFAFSDEAFASLSDSMRVNVMSKSACVKDLILNHIVHGALCSSELDDKMVVSLGGHTLRVQTMVGGAGRIVRVGNAKIVEQNRFTSNGVVHVIDDVIVLENLLTWRDHLLTFNQPLLDALSDLTMDSEPITIFVPPFNATEEAAEREAFALNHILEHTLVTSLAEPTNITTVINSTFFAGVFPRHSPFSISIGSADYSAKPQIGCSRIVNQSIHACNSILHFLDKPLPMVEGSIYDIFSTRPDLSRFYSLWMDSDVASLINSTGPITVFAPSDDAMSRNQFNTLLGNSTRLNAFVRRYIVKGPLCGFDLRRRPGNVRIELLPNEAGETLRPETANGHLFIGGARIQEEELIQSNGIVYVLESPILRVIGGPSTSPLSLASDLLGLFT